MAKIEAISKEVVLVEAMKGDMGEKGDKGSQGATGSVGGSGRDGKQGLSGADGNNGLDGHTGASVVDAKIDLDGHLVIILSDGNEIDAGELPKSDAPSVINYTGGGGTRVVPREGVLANVIEVTEDTIIPNTSLFEDKYNIILVLFAGVTITLPNDVGTKIIEFKQGYEGNGTYTILKAS